MVYKQVLLKLYQLPVQKLKALVKWQELLML